MMGHNIRLKAVIGEIIPKLSLLPLLIWSSVGVNQWLIVAREFVHSPQYWFYQVANVFYLQG